jgi:hypothetical protein
MEIAVRAVVEGLVAEHEIVSPAGGGQEVAAFDEQALVVAPFVRTDAAELGRPPARS